MNILATTVSAQSAYTYRIDTSPLLREGSVWEINLSAHQFLVTINKQTTSIYHLGISLLCTLHTYLATQKAHSLPAAHLIYRLERIIIIKKLLHINTSLRIRPPHAVRSLPLPIETAAFAKGFFSLQHEEALFKQQLRQALNTLDHISDLHQLAESYCDIIKMAEIFDPQKSCFLWQSRSVLHYAVLTADMENVKAAIKLVPRKRLLKELQAQDKEGFSPLDYLKALGRLPQLYRLFPRPSKDLSALYNAAKASTAHPIAFHRLQERLLTKLDGYGRTGLHWSALYGDNENMQAILNNAAGQQCKLLRDIFGSTPFDLAIHAGNASSALQLNAYLALPDIWNFGKKMQPISHRHILAKIQSYFRVQQRNLADLEPFLRGLCHAASLLFTLQADDSFYSGLEAIVSWDGKKSSLDAPLVQLFEAKINALFWFQQTTEQDQQQQSFTWLQKRLAIVDPTCRLQMEYASPLMKMSALELTCWLENYQACQQLNLLIDGSGHTVALKIRKGAFHYYDINLPHRIPLLENAKEVANLISLFKYRRLGLIEDPMEMRITAFYIQETHTTGQRP